MWEAKVSFVFSKRLNPMKNDVGYLYHQRILMRFRTETNKKEAQRLKIKGRT